MTVTQLSNYLKGVFDDEELLHDVTLSGEVAEISYSDKHTFLVLAEGNCSVRCIGFCTRDRIEKGARVALHGSVRFYDKRGTVTFAYDRYFTDGTGSKSAKLAELKEKLKKLGYFENRPQLPRYVVNVIAVTSPEGAAIRDFIRVVTDKSPFVRIRVFPVKVQGDGAAEQMARAIEKINGSFAADAIVLCRGGGSDEDLDCFNDERLATAVARSVIPIISAVGHEVDYTLCDFCAGTRCGTPSIAGETVNAHAQALLSDLGRMLLRCGSAAERKLSECETRVERLGRSIARAASESVSERRYEIEKNIRRGLYALEKKAAVEKNEAESAAHGLKNAASAMLERKSAKVQKLSAVLSVLDPQRSINMGYAAVYSGDKRITRADSLSAGDKLRLMFADGTALAEVSSVKADKK